MLVVYPLPGKGTSVFDMAWEWTVYLLLGVWRCLFVWGIKRSV
nr:MAG TPA: Mitochondrial peculiar membrane protein 1 [Caudoviricetes sp.]